MGMPLSISAAFDERVRKIKNGEWVVAGSCHHFREPALSRPIKKN